MTVHIYSIWLTTVEYCAQRKQGEQQIGINALLFYTPSNMLQLQLYFRKNLDIKMHKTI